MPDAPANPKSFRLQEGDAFGFSDAGEREAITWPSCTESSEVELLGRLKETGAIFPDEAAALEVIRSACFQQDRADTREALLKLVGWLAIGKSRDQSGNMVHILAHYLRLPGYRTQSELAGKLGMTQGRVSQLIKEIGRLYR
jgi:hypothetical protein